MPEEAGLTGQGTPMKGQEAKVDDFAPIVEYKCWNDADGVKVYLFQPPLVGVYDNCVKMVGIAIMKKPKPTKHRVERRRIGIAFGSVMIETDREPSKSTRYYEEWETYE